MIFGRKNSDEEDDGVTERDEIIDTLDDLDTGDELSIEATFGREYTREVRAIGDKYIDVSDTNDERLIHRGAGTIHRAKTGDNDRIGPGKGIKKLELLNEEDSDE